MKKLLSFLLIITLSFALVGCDLYKGKKRIVAMTYEGGIFDASFNQQCLDGLKLLASQSRISYFENLNKEEFPAKLETIVNEKHELIWVIEPAGKEELLNMAKKYPNQSFGLIDDTYDEIPQNVATVTFREYEGAFLAGYIAGRTTQSNKIGYLGGVKDSNAIENEYGFKGGILYAAKELEKTIDVKSDYTQTYTDRVIGEERAGKLYKEGCDIIFQTARTCGLGVIDVAMKQNKLVIGYGSDQSSIAPNNVLTSVIKDMSNAINIVSTNFLDEEQIGGKNYDFGLKERIIGISKTNTNMKKEVYTKSIELRQNIVNGTISVPKDEKEYLKLKEEFKIKK